MGTSRGGRNGGRAKRDRDPAKIAIKERVVDEARAKLAGKWRLSKTILANTLAEKHKLKEYTVRDWLKPLTFWRLKLTLASRPGLIPRSPPKRRP